MVNPLHPRILRILAKMSPRMLSPSDIILRLGTYKTTRDDIKAAILDLFEQGEIIREENAADRPGRPGHRYQIAPQQVTASATIDSTNW